MESARAMIAHGGLPNSYWAEAVNTAAYIRNQMPTTAIKDDQTLYERLYGRKSNVSHLKVFGCAAYAHVPNAEQQKLDKKTEKLRFVSNSKESKGYQLIDEKTRKIVLRRDVIFDFSLSGIKAETEAVKPKEMIEVDPNSMVGSRPQYEPRRSEWQRRPPV